IPWTRRLDGGRDLRPGNSAQPVRRRTGWRSRLVRDRSESEERKVSQRLISQLAHVELLTPKPDESLRFMRDVMGLYESDRVGQSVYLRGWGDFFHHSVVLTEADQPGLGHAAWRAEGREELELAVQRLEATGLGEGW